MDEETAPGTLKVGEPHPSALKAYQYLQAFEHFKLMNYLGAFSSCALSDNRPAEICAETFNRFIKREPISDRYLLGLAWAIRDMEEEDLNHE